MYLEWSYRVRNKLDHSKILHHYITVHNGPFALKINFWFENKGKKGKKLPKLQKLQNLAAQCCKTQKI